MAIVAQRITVNEMVESSILTQRKNYVHFLPLVKRHDVEFRHKKNNKKESGA